MTVVQRVFKDLPQKPGGLNAIQQSPYNKCPKTYYAIVLVYGRLKFPAPLTLDDALRPGTRNAEASRGERGEDRPVVGHSGSAFKVLLASTRSPV